ncbi:isochorismate synthase [Stanieria cyanosphaera PCC 7437]|uniref:isochorismate synthase n=1 Tax=Stanieria cyanosphaera (strain ATCC 29371 / PCC 7437) TaxID=111780 RepID=K9XV14_STAC7|nr:isochorismate synthase [Stanieria cyanosphaera]AFZ35904.1 isochorismate synthase [Stanieria cyanosphaera PCC 7437]
MTQSRISMPVVSELDLIFQDHLKLDNFWDQQQLVSEPNEPKKIISFVQRIPTIDPLAFLQNFNHSNSLHFYWENPRKQEAVIACGVTQKLLIDSRDRFKIAQNFIQKCLKKTVRKGETSITGAGPHLFCTFTFFPDADKSYSPFPAATVFLPRLQLIKKNKSCLLIVNVPVNYADNSKLIVEEIKQKINSIDWSLQQKLNSEINECFASNYNSISEDSEYFKSVVTSALNSIAIDEFSKIVLAYATDVVSPVPFRLIKSLDNLRQRHPDCYIFSTSNGRDNNFIGASPERLVSIQNKQLVTDALAGSAPRGKTTAEDVQLANLLLKNRKEKREHQAVSDFLIERLRQLDLKPQQLPLQLLQLSNIQHLWTPIYAHLSHDLDPLEIVAQLHPTPAVAGVSTEIACEQIRRYEKFDRSLYAAPLGWVDYQGNSEFIVGIRSALIEGNRARLYAGAGIVSGSNPEKEFAEIQLKLQSLLKALV